VKVLFGEPDKMFRLIGEALAPSPEGDSFLRAFFLTESADPVAMLKAWSAERNIPSGIEVAHCTRREDLAAMLGEAQVLVVENAAIRAAEIENATLLKLIQLFGRDTRNIDLDACARKNITVRPLDRYSNRLVTEHVILFMLALTRGLDECRAAVQLPSPLPPSGWAFNWPACKGVRGLAGRVVGLVGLGQIGAMVAEYLRPFGATVLYTRRNRDPSIEKKLGITYASMEELVSRADILSVHVPYTPGTHHLINAELLDRAKQGQVIVNTARGSIIDERALVAALRSGKIGGAALDVFSSEPLPPDHPLRGLDNVILTPHVAAGTRDRAWLDREIGPVVDSILEALKSQPAGKS
jgi:phosphoglycerate dehydrogenase-like enzyme